MGKGEGCDELGAVFSVLPEGKLLVLLKVIGIYSLQMFVDTTARKPSSEKIGLPV